MLLEGIADLILSLKFQSIKREALRFARLPASSTVRSILGSGIDFLPHPSATPLDKMTKSPMPHVADQSLSNIKEWRGRDVQKDRLTCGR